MSAPAPADAAAPAKGGKNKLFMIGGVVLALAGGGGYYYKTQAAAHAEEAPAPKHEPSPKERGLVPFEPFVANLADAGGRRFARVTVELVVANALQAAEMEETPVLKARARAIILELIGMQLAETLVTPDGKVALRQQIAEKVAEALQEIEIVDVLFSDFVVQF